MSRQALDLSFQSPDATPAPAWTEPHPSEPHPGRELLDQSAGFLGIGRSWSFPFPQWRDSDAYRTVYFDEGQGHPVVFVHGLGANATHWEHVVKGLVHKNRVLGLDMAGCGWNLKPAHHYDLALLKSHLLGFLERRKIRRCTLVGHSLGGMVCLATALERPALVDALALVGAAGVAPLPRWMKAAAPLFLRKKLLFATLALGAELILNNVFVDSPQENLHVRRFYASAMRDAPGYPNLKDFARVCETLCRDVVNRDFSHHLDSLDIPVLGIWGDADKLTPLKDVLRCLGRIPRVRTIILKRCGHMPMVERPAETLFHIERFLNNPPH
jgi:pimeloyl-ACP methyl ester carboxylesterase